MQAASSTGHTSKTVIKRKPRNPLADNPREKQYVDQKLCKFTKIINKVLNAENHNITFDYKL